MSQTFIGVLSGGAGTRLWPLSRTLAPKQFYDLGDTGKNLLVDTIERLEKWGPCSIITTDSLAKPTQGILNRFDKKAEIIAEPEARNTAPAVALFTYLSLRKDKDALLGLFPADHVVLNQNAFDQALESAFAAAREGRIVTLGIHPDYPATGYGYIEMEASASPSEARAVPVKSFLEKPIESKAKELIATGKVAWNAGMMIFAAQTMKDAFLEHLPGMWKALETLEEDLSNLASVYVKLEKISIDYGIMERANNIDCVPVDMGWSDVGCWEEVSKLQRDSKGFVEEQASDNFHLSTCPQDKKVAFLGTESIVTVDTPDALLVMKKGAGQDVKKIVETLKTSHPALTEQHTSEERPWGRFEVLLDTEGFKSKRITVLPGQKLSYQSHKHRSEHWTVVKGKAQVTLDGKVIDLAYGEHVYIPLGAKHRIANPGKEAMEFIEVQVGEYFGEDDIIRYEDDYGRS